MKMIKELEVGDTIHCKDKEEMANLDVFLCAQGIFCDYMYKKDGVKGLWLKVLKIEKRPITDELLKQVEQVLGFTLYDWQRDYIHGKIKLNKKILGERGNGKTLAYILKILLDDCYIPKMELKRHSDNMGNGPHYNDWFLRYALEINHKLRAAGIRTSLIDY